MAILLDDDELQELRDAVGPQGGDDDSELYEVWRPKYADAGVVAGGAGLGKYGTKVTTGSPVRSDQGSEKVAEHYGRKQLGRAQGTESLWGTQVISAQDYTFSFTEDDSLDIRSMDVLVSGSDRFNVTNPGAPQTYGVLRIVAAVKVG